MLKYFFYAAVAANLVVFAVSTCTTDESSVIADSVKTYLEENDCSDEETQAIITNVANAYTSMTLKRAFQIGMMHPTSNKVISMVPVVKAVSAASMVEKSDLLAENLALLHLESVDQVRTAMPIIEKIVNAETEYSTFKVNMQVFGDSSNPFSTTFTDQNLEICAITSGYVDYSDPTGAAATMNEYVKSVTDYETKDIITENAFTSTPGAVLLGSSSSRVQWGSDVTVEDAGNMDFNVVNLQAKKATVSVPYIKVSGPLKVGTYEDATIVSVPLAGACELITVTNAKGGFPFLNLLYTLSDTKKFNEIVFQGETQDANLYLPNITYSTRTEHFAAAWKLSGASHDLLVPNDCNVCEGVFDDSTECSYLQTMTHNLEWTITSQCAETSERRRRDTTDAETTDCAASDYTINKAFLSMVMCPLKVPHFAYVYMGNEQ